MRLWAHAGTAAKHALIAHELAVVFAERPSERAITRIRRIIACRPLPDVSVELPGSCARRRCDWMQSVRFAKVAGDRYIDRGDFPLDLGRQSLVRPTRVGVRFVVTHMTYRLALLYRLHTGERVRPPLPIEPFP